MLFKASIGNTEYLRNIQRVWGMSTQNRLVEVPLKTIKCRNPDYGAD